MLEPIELGKDASVADLISILKSGKYAKDSHKLLVFKGRTGSLFFCVGQVVTLRIRQ